MPIQLTNQFRESIIGNETDDFDCSSTIKDIYKLNSVLYSIPYQDKNEEDGNTSDNSQSESVLFDPNEVFNIISNGANVNNTEKLSSIKEDSTVKFNKKSSSSYEDDSGTIKYRRLPTSKTSNSIVSTNSESSTYSTDTAQFNLNNITNNIIQEANSLLSLEESYDDNGLFDRMLTNLEIAMEYEITQIHNTYVNMKNPIINELQRRCM